MATVGVKSNDPLIPVTGDGSCSCYAVGITLCTALLVNPTLELNPVFLEKMSDFHPNFKPQTQENLVLWIKTYAKTRRDMEFLLGPVLRYWYESETKSLKKEEALSQLVANRPIHLGDEAIKWLCTKLQFNLKMTERENNFTFDVISDYAKRPVVHIAHKTEHFDIKLGELAAFYLGYIQKTDSFIYSRNGNDVDKVWNYKNAPLEQPALEAEKKAEIVAEAEVQATQVTPNTASGTAGKSEPEKVLDSKPTATVLPLFELEKNKESNPEPWQALTTHLCEASIDVVRASNKIYVEHGFNKAMALTQDKEKAIQLLAKVACNLKLESSKADDIAAMVVSLRDDVRTYEHKQAYDKRWRNTK